MKEFIEKRANSGSISHRKLILGVGVNDAWYMTQVKDSDGVKSYCPYYTKWSGMLTRCYSKKYQKRQPTYVGCSVCTEWLIFSTFRKWMETQDWKGKQLDKDILVKGNKVYSPDTCVFVSKGLNVTFKDWSRVRGKYPQGVSLSRQGKYVVKCNANGVRTRLGTYSCVKQAEIAYCTHKIKVLTELSKQTEAEAHEALKAAILNEAQMMSERVKEISAFSC